MTTLAQTPKSRVTVCINQLMIVSAHEDPEDEGKPSTGDLVRLLPHQTVIGHPISFPRPFPAPRPEQIHLRLLATTDLHAHILPHDYAADRPAPGIGLAQAAACAETLRREVPNALLFDNGDFLQGTPLADWAAEQLEADPQAPHPVITAMNAAGIDAATLGNHEFNYGTDILRHALRQARFPVVSANIRPAMPEGRPLCPPFALIERQMTDGAGQSQVVTIGVIGFAPPQSLTGDSHLRVAGLESHDILETARQTVPVMRAQGADLVVALAHSGLGGGHAVGCRDHAAGALAESGLVDAVIAGHSHLTFPPPGATCAGERGIPVVMPGFWGRWLGVIDLLLAPSEGGWQISRHHAALCPSGAPPVPPHPAVCRAVEPAHRAVRDHQLSPTGHHTTGLTSHFELIRPSGGQRLIAAAMRRHLAELLHESDPAHPPILAAVPSFKCGGNNGPGWFVDIPEGPLLTRHLADLYPYPNRFRALRLTGADIADWLEVSAGIYRQILPEIPDQPLIDPRFPSHRYDLIEGLSYRIDLSKPARFTLYGDLPDPDRRRISEIRLNGAPLAPEAELLLTTSNFRADETGARRSLKGRLIVESPRLNRDLLQRHLAMDPPPAPAPTPGPLPAWDFAPMPGTTVIFDTGPGAARHLSEIAAFAPEIVGRTASGFLRLRLHL